MHTTLLKRFGFTQILMTLALLLSASVGQAGTRDSGGGTGIRVGNRIVVLDLVEAGLENSAAIPAIVPDGAIVEALRKNLSLPEPMKSQVLMPLARKLTEIQQFGSSTTGMFIAHAFSFYHFQAVSYKLTSIDDVDSAIGEARLQLAVRKGPTIYISIPNWAQLDEVNRVALLMHEIIYAFQPLPDGCHDVYDGGILSYSSHTDCTATPIDMILATSSKARYFNSYLFRADWRVTWKKVLKKEMSVDDANATYSNLFAQMDDESGNHSRISTMKPGKNWDDKPDDTLQPVYSQLEVRSRGPTRMLTAGTSVSQMIAMCARAEFAEPAEDDYAHYGWHELRWSLKAQVGQSTVGLKSEMDVVSFDTTRFDDYVYINSIVETRNDCVNQLNKIRKTLR